jgi:hypothetical protein
MADATSKMPESRLQTVIWYSVCVLLGLPWWLFVDVELGVVAFFYFWIWAVLLLMLPMRIRLWDRIAGFLVAIGLTFGVWLTLMLYLGPYGDAIEN